MTCAPPLHARHRTPGPRPRRHPSTSASSPRLRPRSHSLLQPDPRPRLHRPTAAPPGRPTSPTSPRAAPSRHRPRGEHGNSPTDIPTAAFLDTPAVRRLRAHIRAGLPGPGRSGPHDRRTARDGGAVPRGSRPTRPQRLVADAVLGPAQGRRARRPRVLAGPNRGRGVRAGARSEPGLHPRGREAGATPVPGPSFPGSCARLAGCAGGASGLAYGRLYGGSLRMRRQPPWSVPGPPGDLTPNRRAAPRRRPGCSRVPSGPPTGATPTR